MNEIDNIADTGEINTNPITEQEQPVQDGQPIQPAEQERVFNQTQLNAVVGRRLAEERQKLFSEVEQRERELNHREFINTATDRIKAEGLPVGIMEALNTSSPEALEKSLSIIGQLFKHRRGMINLDTYAKTYPIDWNGRDTYLYGDTARNPDGGSKPIAKINESDLIKAAMELPGSKEIIERLQKK